MRVLVLLASYNNLTHFSQSVNPTHLKHVFHEIVAQPAANVKVERLYSCVTVFDSEPISSVALQVIVVEIRSAVEEEERLSLSGLTEV